MNKKIAKIALPLFIIWPLGAFICSLFDIKSKKSAFVFVVFAMLFGFSISFSDTSADSYRYAEAFKRFDNTLTYSSIVDMYRSGELRDMYRLLLFYFTSLFSNNPKVMYAFAGLIYGVFSYLSLRVFVNERGPRWDRYMFVLALLFFTYSSLANINGFRFWTGGLVLFYSTYNFIIQKKTGWGIGILITPLFHYGFVLIVPILILYRFIEWFMYNSQTVRPILFYFFIIAYFASWVLGTNVINLSFLSQTDAFSGAIGDRLDYVNSAEIAELVNKRSESSIFLSVQKYFNYGIKIYIFIAVLYVRKWIGKMSGDKTEYTRLFAFVLFYYAVALLATSIPSGARFLNIAHLFMFILLGKLYVIHKKKSMKRLIIWSLPAFSFTIAFTNFMLPILILSPTVWYGNLFWIFIEGMYFNF